SLGWRLPATPPPLSLAFAPDSVSVPLGAAYLADAPFSWRAGERLALPARAVAWSSSAPAIASVDSTGRVTARQPGSVRIIAALPPAADTLLVVVTADTAETILTETWERLDSTRWESFGEPRPRLVRTADGRNGLNNGGDGRFVSGVVSAATFDAAGGLGVEARTSLGITQTQWQLQVVRIAADRSHAMASWDRGTRLPPRIHQYASEECVAGYPNGEGLTALGAVGIHGAGAAASTPVDSSWRLGGWHTVRIQILADGRCGIAIDGRPIWISPSAIPTNTPFRLWLEGNSSQTDQIIVGPVEVWRGMKTDLRWDDLGRPSPREVRRTRRRHRKPRRAPYPDLKPPRPVELR
ncbi:MAG: Ig-like domain-containing protein, partial [Gemmatimonadetes bacterium]|nr:Ig-like domain-containing protein [Gemmatimonadota bacterium]